MINKQETTNWNFGNHRYMGEAPYDFRASKKMLGKDHTLEIEISTIKFPPKLDQKGRHSNTTIVITETKGETIAIDWYIFRQKEREKINIYNLMNKPEGLEQALEELLLSHVSEEYDGTKWLAEGNMNEVDTILKHREYIKEALERNSIPSTEQYPISPHN